MSKKTFKYTCSFTYIVVQSSTLSSWRPRLDLRQFIRGANVEILSGYNVRFSLANYHFNETRYSLSSVDKLDPLETKLPRE